MRAWGVLVAAGAGERLGGAGGVPKAFRDVGGVPMLVRAARALANLEGFLIVAPAGWEERAVEVTAPHVGGAWVASVTGGSTRQASVRAGIDAIGHEMEAVVVHDGARPLAGSELTSLVLQALSRADGAVCAIPLADTIKRVTGDRILETADRSGLWRAQTPQAFLLPVLREAHARAARDGVEATDDAALLELIGATVVVVPGDERNIKVTTRADLEAAEALLGREAAPQ